MPVAEALDNLARLAGPDRLDESLDDLVAAYADYRRRHQAGARTTDHEDEALTAVGVDVDALVDGSDPAAYLAGMSVAVLSDALTVAEASVRLDVTRERVRQRLRQTPRTLVGVQVNGGQWRLPAFQFAHGAAVANRGGRVIAALPEGLALRRIDAFFTQPNDVLRDDRDRPLSPMMWIVEGRDLDPVVELAAVADMLP